MTQAVLNRLMTLYVHMNRTSAMCVVGVANDFVRESRTPFGCINLENVCRFRSCKCPSHTE